MWLGVGVRVAASRAVRLLSGIAPLRHMNHTAISVREISDIADAISEEGQSRFRPW
jgi:hypothetical protein